MRERAKGLGRFLVPIAFAAVLIAALLAGGLVPALEGRLDPTATSPGPPASLEDAVDLGVFEPVRGRIVFRVGSHLEGVDPDDPAAAVVIEPGDLGLGTKAMPAGWSADGTMLAIQDGQRGRGYILDTAGVLRRLELMPRGAAWCCSNVASPWLSPDGSRVVAVWPPSSEAEPWRLVIIDVRDPTQRHVVELLGIEGAAAQPAWSPDGARIAYASQTGGQGESPTIHVLDLASGQGREIITAWALVRHVAWSPDGMQLLVVASPGPMPASGGFAMGDPLEAGVYLVDVADGRARMLTPGHFTVAAWSPDGRRIAAIDYAVTARSVVVIDVHGGGQPRELVLLSTTHSGHRAYVYTGVTWNPLAPP